MRVPDKSELPLFAKPQEILFDDQRIASFQKAFRESKKYTPPTYGAAGLQGVFEIVDTLKTNWRDLLHATQSFTYHSKLVVPCSLVTQAKLLDCRLRAGMYWLTFETEGKDKNTNALVLTSKTLIMVKAPTEGSKAL